MNEPIEYAQSIHGKTTAKAMREIVGYGYDALSLHANATSGRESYSDSFVFELVARKKESEKQARTLSGIPGYVSNGETSHRKVHTNHTGGTWTTYDEGFRPLRGFWYLSGCPRERLLAILDLLPKDATVAFFVYLDAGTNELCVMSESHTEQGLHVDHLYLKASYVKNGKEKQVEFLIDATTSAHNTARFGSPKNDRDQGDQVWFTKRSA